MDKFFSYISYKFPKGYPDVRDPKDKALLFEIVHNLINEDSSTVTKEDIINILKDEDLTPAQLKSISFTISNIKYKDGIISYINSKGKAPSMVSEAIYNKMVSTGEAALYVNYLNNMKSYNSLKDSGDFFEEFKDFSKDLINFILSQEPSVGGVATGKGEILLSVMCSDVEDSDKGGDLIASGQLIEVKNKGAIPIGQKAQFGKNTIKSVYSDIENKINPKLDSNIDFENFKGSRPFERFNLAFNQISEMDKDLAKEYLNVLMRSYESNYPGVEFTSVNPQSYIKGDTLDWKELELQINKAIVQYYINTEGFTEVLFVNDKSKKYKKVDVKNLLNSLGKDIQIKMKDGLPRWSYNF